MPQKNDSLVECSHKSDSDVVGEREPEVPKGGKHLVSGQRAAAVPVSGIEVGTPRHDLQITGKLEHIRK